MTEPMSDLDILVHNVVNRVVPDKGQHMANVDMFETILRYTKQTEMKVLQEIDYALMYNNGENAEFDTIAQMLAFLQMTCFAEIIASKRAHAIFDIAVRYANAELWYSTSISSSNGINTPVVPL